jgi:hypothetical protein
LFRNLENQTKAIDTLLRRKEQLQFRNNSLVHINYLIEQILYELDSLSSQELLLFPVEITERLLNIDSLQTNSFENLVHLLKEIIKWKYTVSIQR